MKKIWFNWSKSKKIISIVSMCLCVVLLGGCVVNTFVDIEDGKVSLNLGDSIDNISVFGKVRNDQNLLDPEYYTERIAGDQKGVMVTVNDDGSITLDGKATASSNLRLYGVSDTDCYGCTFTVGAVDLGEDAEKSHLWWRYDGQSDNLHTYSIPSNKSMTFTVSGERSSNYTFYLCIVEGDSFDNVTIYPTLNYGYVVQPFYEENSLGDSFSELIGAKKVRNEDNLLDPEIYEDIDNDYDDLEVTVNDDGSITLDGEATSAISLELASFTDMSLVGVKLMVAGVDFGADAPGAYLKWGYDGEATCPKQVINIPTGYDYPITPLANGLDSTLGSFRLTIEISAGDKFDNVTIYPVLNYGVTAASYFE